MNIKRSICALFFLTVASVANGQETSGELYKEPFRPQVHFSPAAHWMNDPNGMVYFKGVYHLFFQYYPNGTTWGPMHWGHTVSKDLMHWKELPIALYPDSLGYIFSGSVVVDSNNTSGFGKNGKTPLVAMFTHHDPVAEQHGKNNFQNQSLAYSLDEGATWTKYKDNPVIKNPGIRDFRDPKVMWYAAENKWVMTLATLDHITFFSSPNLKDWKLESEFGKEIGAHGGVWECPDLFPLKLNGKTYWLLIVNLNPGGPNGGSATQYFVGQFNGNKFIPVDKKLRWVDYGPDEYAGITWSNTGNRKVFLGWMSNWIYANQVPTQKWRNAMTMPRELFLRQVQGEILLASEPVKELSRISLKPFVNRAVFKINEDTLVVKKPLPDQYTLQFQIDKLDSYTIALTNSAGDKLTLGYDKTKNQFFIDRRNSGETNFNPEFAKVFYATRLSGTKHSNLKLIVDASSIELFADDGLNVMTCVFFPKSPLNHIMFQGMNGKTLKNLKISGLKRIW